MREKKTRASLQMYRYWFELLNQAAYAVTCIPYVLISLLYSFYSIYRMRLFADDSGSPVPQQWVDDEITAVITPYSKVDNSFDSGFKSQSDISVSIILMFLLPMFWIIRLRSYSTCNRVGNFERRY